MRYTGPKRKLCRREKKNLFGTEKYVLKKGEKAPGQHGGAMQRMSEYGTLLRNKQAFKRMYALTEKQFSKIINSTSKKYSKNKGISHDKAVVQFLERRCDVVLLRSGFAKTIMQARQMVVHGHWTLNGQKHNVPSYFMNGGDVLSLKKALVDSSLYEDAHNISNVPVHLKVDKNKYTVEVLQLPDVDIETIDADVLKVIEFYARA